MLETNAMIFYQGILTNSECLKLDRITNRNTRWSFYDKQKRVSVAKIGCIKFGFVLKTIKSC